MTTKEAFNKLITEDQYRSVFKPQTYRSLKMRFKANALEEQTMKNWLLKAGFKHSENWEEPKTKTNKKK